MASIRVTNLEPFYKSGTELGNCFLIRSSDDQVTSSTKLRNNDLILEYATGRHVEPSLKVRAHEWGCKHCDYISSRDVPTDSFGGVNHIFRNCKVIPAK